MYSHRADPNGPVKSRREDKHEILIYDVVLRRFFRGLDGFMVTELLVSFGVCFGRDPPKAGSIVDDDSVLISSESWSFSRERNLVSSSDSLVVYRRKWANKRETL